MCHQLVVRSMLHNLSVVNVENGRAIFDCGKSVSDDEAGASLEELVKPPLQKDFRLGVDR